MIDIQLLPRQRMPNGVWDLRQRAVAYRDGVEIGRIEVGQKAAPICVLCRKLWHEGAPEDEEVNVWRGDMPIFMKTSVEFWGSRSYFEADSGFGYRIMKNWRDIGSLAHLRGDRDDGEAE
jgi:hypothetical protein